MATTIFTVNYSGTYGSKYEFRANASESNISTSNNTSKITVDIYIRRTDSSSNGAYNFNGTNWSITIDGTTTNGNSTWDTRNTTAWQYLGSASKTVTHNSDGTKNVSISATHSTHSSGGITGASGSGSFKTETIIRNSYTDSKPTWTAPGSVKCNITRYASYTHTVRLELKDSDGNWTTAGTLENQTTSATFNSETVMKKVFQILNGRSSCSSRFRIYTNGPNQWTTGPTGTCTADDVNTVNAPIFTATNTGTITISKGNSNFTTTIKVVINGQNIGSVSQTSATSFSFNNTTVLRECCMIGLAQAASKTYTVTATTYYSGVKVRSSVSKSGTCNAPAADKITSPNFTAGNNLSVSITTASNELSREIIFQIKNSSGSWVNIITQGTTTTKSFTWANTEAQRDIIFTALQQSASRETRFLVTTYYSGVKVRSQTTTSGTCSAPAVSTCNAPNWVAGNSFTATIKRASSLLTHTVILQAKDKNGAFQIIGSVTKSSNTSIVFANTTAANTTVFNCLAQANSRETKITITTYYKNIQIRSGVYSSGILSSPGGSTLSTIPTWIAGDSLTLNINRPNANYTHTLVIKVGGQIITTLTNIKTSATFGTSDSERTKIFTALAQSASKPSEVLLTTYYNGVQVGYIVSKIGTCTAPSSVSPSAPTWTAGNSFSANIALSKSYLYYTIELKVGTVSVQSYSYTKATQLGFAGSTALNLKAYQGLNKNAQATSQFVVKMFYKKSDGNYLQVGPAKITNGTCTALAANTITTPNWRAGSSFVATISRKSLNLYSNIKLKVNGQIVQEYTGQTSPNLNFSLTFANTKEINTKIYTALAQAASKSAILEITTYYGTSTSNMVQVRTPIQVNGVCTSSAVATGNLTSSQTPAIIDNTSITCNLTKPNSEYTLVIEVRYNGVLITTFNPNSSTTSVTFDSASYIEELYKAIPEQTSASLQFKIITKYNGVQVQQPKIFAINMEANKDTVKAKIDNTLQFETTAKVIDRINTFIDNTSMIGSKLSTLLIEMAQGYFYLDSKYGGFIKQIKAQIANSPIMTVSYDYTENDKEFNNEQTRIVSPAFLNVDTEHENGIVMGPYDFTSVTEAGTKNNLVISVKDSRGYITTKTVELKIFPYKSPTIKIDDKNTGRDSTNKKIISLYLSGEISSLYKIENGEKVQTNLLTENNNEGLILQYREYGSSAAYSTLKPVPRVYNSTCTKYSTTKWNTGALFDTNKTYEILATAKDSYGRTNTSTMIILPDTPLLSFRDSQIGVNIVPRKLNNISPRASTADEDPALDINGYIYSNGREIPTMTIVSTWTN